MYEINREVLPQITRRQLLTQGQSAVHAGKPLFEQMVTVTAATPTDDASLAAANAQIDALEARIIKWFTDINNVTLLHRGPYQAVANDAGVTLYHATISLAYHDTPVTVHF